MSTTQTVIDQLQAERDEWRRELKAAEDGKTVVTKGWKTEARSQIRKLAKRISQLGGTPN